MAEKKKKRTKSQERIFTIFFMFIITLVFISVLTAVNLLTKDRIKFNQKIGLIRAVVYSSGIELENRSIDIKESESEEAESDGTYKIEILNDNGKGIGDGVIKSVFNDDGDVKYYTMSYEERNTNDNIFAYVFRTRGPGLWGEITALIGFNKELTSITGIEFVEQSETPGLGAKITKMWFKEQFKGKNGPKAFSESDKLFTTVPQDSESGDSEFSAITGATATSNYVRNIINATIKNARQELLSQ